MNAMRDAKHALRHTANLRQFGERIRSEREARGYSLGELANALRVTKGYLSRLERAKAAPSRRITDLIAAILRLDAGRLHLLAGHLPNDVAQILYDHPTEAPLMLREAFAGYGAAPSQHAPSPQANRGMARKLTPGLALGHLYELVNDDCMQWLKHRPDNSIHAIVTDPPYGLKEYTEEEQAKRRQGRGGVWRIPPTLGGHTRRPLPRFTVLTATERRELREFSGKWAELAFRVLVPGGHVFIATNPLVSHLVCIAVEEVGFEKRAEVVRLVQTLRGGDRPKNAHDEFQMVTVMPRSAWEPWLLFRKPCEGRVQDNLRKWGTGGLRRTSLERPFCDVIPSAPARGAERDISSHPSLKPQAFMRQVVYASLPLGEGVVLDPFAGSGSTVAAATALGYRSIGIELDPGFYQMARKAVPRLAALPFNGNGRTFTTARVPVRQDGLFP